MKYKNIIFDFGNVIGKFDGYYILKHFCSDERDLDLLSSAVYRNWNSLDSGAVDYDENIENTAALVPEHLKETVREFFRDWPRYVHPLESTLSFIDELKERQIPIYLLSNAPSYFVKWTANYEFLRKFDGVVFSAPVKMAKPEPEIYQYLFRTYNLKPEECFFIDDLKANVDAAKALGMDGIIFRGDIDEVKRQIDF